jgi:uncharacterized membrane protein YgcG
MGCLATRLLSTPKIMVFRVYYHCCAWFMGPTCHALFSFFSFSTLSSRRCWTTRHRRGPAVASSGGESMGGTSGERQPASGGGGLGRSKGGGGRGGAGSV